MQHDFKSSSILGVWGYPTVFSSAVDPVVWHPSLKPGQKKWQPSTPASRSGPCIITSYSIYIFSLPLQLTWMPIQVFPGTIQASGVIFFKNFIFPSRTTVLESPGHSESPQTTCSTICCNLAQKPWESDQAWSLAKTPPEWQRPFLPPPPTSTYTRRQSPSPPPSPLLSP